MGHTEWHDLASTDADLQQLIAAWDGLPEALRRAILAMTGTYESGLPAGGKLDHSAGESIAAVECPAACVVLSHQVDQTRRLGSVFFSAETGRFCTIIERKSNRLTNSRASQRQDRLTDSLRKPF